MYDDNNCNYYVTYCAVIFCVCYLGVLHWGKTVAGLTPGVKCPHDGVSTKQEAMAYHSCTLLGEWATLDTDQCQYTSPITRVLHQYAQVSMK